MDTKILVSAVFVCRFGSDYMESGPQYCFHRVVKGRSLDFIHPGDSMYTGLLDDQTMILQVKSKLLKYRLSHQIYSIEDQEILGKLLGIDHLEEESEDGYWSYDTLGGCYADGIDGDKRMFSSQGIELLIGYEDQILKLIKTRVFPSYRLIFRSNLSISL